MERPPEHLRHHALALASAAEQLAGSAGDRACATELPAALEFVEQALDALSRACEGAALPLVPISDRYEPVALRFARAACDWPGAHEGRGPSYECLSQVLASFDDVAASLRAARGRAARARELLQDTTGSPARAHAALGVSA